MNICWPLLSYVIFAFQGVSLKYKFWEHCFVIFHKINYSCHFLLVCQKKKAVRPSSLHSCSSETKCCFEPSLWGEKRSNTAPYNVLYLKVRCCQLRHTNSPFLSVIPKPASAEVGRNVSHKYTIVIAHSTTPLIHSAFVLYKQNAPEHQCLDLHVLSSP